VDPPIVNEADQQSDTPSPTRADLGRCLTAMVTVMASEAMLESQKRESEPFDFDDPDNAIEAIKCVSTSATDEVLDDIQDRIFKDKDEAGTDSVNEFVFIADIMEQARRRDNANFEPGTSTFTTMSSHEDFKGGAEIALIDSDLTSRKYKHGHARGVESVPHHSHTGKNMNGEDDRTEVSRHTAVTTPNGHLKVKKSLCDSVGNIEEERNSWASSYDIAKRKKINPTSDSVDLETQSRRNDDFAETDSTMVTQSELNYMNNGNICSDRSKPGRRVHFEDEDVPLEEENSSESDWKTSPKRAKFSKFRNQVNNSQRGASVDCEGGSDAQLGGAAVGGMGLSSAAAVGSVTVKQQAAKSTNKVDHEDWKWLIKNKYSPLFRTSAEDEDEATTEPIRDSVDQLVVDDNEPSPSTSTPHPVSKSSKIKRRAKLQKLHIQERKCM
jgi:hypothetical protein